MLTVGFIPRRSCALLFSKFLFALSVVGHNFLVLLPWKSTEADSQTQCWIPWIVVDKRQVRCNSCCHFIRRAFE